MKYSRINKLLFVFLSCFMGVAQAQIVSPDSTSQIVTGAISSVTGETLQKTFTSNIGNTLYGQIPGLTVMQTSGQAGLDFPTMTVRGVNTFSTGSNMLVIVDGFPSTEIFFQQLTPQEIESITLLKDASATAIYGNRGANGVLVVTTKKGVAGQLKINFSAQYGLQQPTRLPDFLGSYDYATLYNEALRNDGITTPKYNAAALEAYKTGSNPLLYPNVNWQDEVLRKTAPLANYNFNASGGNDFVRYFVLFNAATNGGLQKRTADLSEYSKNADYSRYNFRTNVDVILSNRLSAVVTLGGTVEDAVNPGTSNSTIPLFNLISSIPANAFPVYAADGKFGGNDIYSNPYGDILQKGYFESNGRAAQATFQLTHQLDFITQGLSISGYVGFNSYFRSFSVKTRDYERTSISQNAAGELVYTSLGQNTSLSADEKETYQERNLSFRAHLDYKRKFDIHAIDATLVANNDDYIYTNQSFSYRNIGLGGRVTYTFNDKYIAEGSFGYNGSENFPKGHRFGFFPAGSIGWILSNEDFLRGNQTLNFLKLRGSYGLVGNDNIGGTRFMFDQYYIWGNKYNLGYSGGVDTYYEGTLANPHVTWEKEKKANIGVDAVLFNQWTVNVDVFNHNRYDILSRPYRTIPEFIGVETPLMNIGKVNNKGFEAVVRYDSKKTTDFNYFVEASAWYATNKIDYNGEMLQENEYLYRTGQRIGQPFVLEAIGFFKDEADIANSPRQIFSDVKPGDIKYKNQNPDKDDVIDQNDVVPIGYTDVPEYTFALRSGFVYKGFDLNFLLQGVTNRTIYQSGKQFEAFQNNGTVSSVALGRWTPETADKATYPRLSASNNPNNFEQPSSFWQKDGSFLKLRNLEIGYTLPQRLSEKVKIEKTRIFFNGTNLFSIDHLDGVSDPETLLGYPAMRTFSLGINIQL
jgi:TonB-linked SusC/RagA family outer membrane protein